MNLLFNNSHGFFSGCRMCFWNFVSQIEIDIKRNLLKDPIHPSHPIHIQRQMQDTILKKNSFAFNILFREREHIFSSDIKNGYKRCIKHKKCCSIKDAFVRSEIKIVWIDKCWFHFLSYCAQYGDFYSIWVPVESLESQIICLIFRWDDESFWAKKNL